MMFYNIQTKYFLKAGDTHYPVTLPTHPSPTQTHHTHKIHPQPTNIIWQSDQKDKVDKDKDKVDRDNVDKDKDGQGQGEVSSSILRTFLELRSSFLELYCGQTVWLFQVFSNFLIECFKVIANN